MTNLELLANLRSQEKELKKEILNAEVLIYGEFQKELDTKEKGVFTFGNEEYRVKITKKINTKVDQTKASQLSSIAFKAKYSLDAKAYSALSDEDKAVVDDCLTTSPAKPSFVVEKLTEE